MAIGSDRRIVDRDWCKEFMLRSYETFMVMMSCCGLSGAKRLLFVCFRYCRFTMRWWEMWSSREAG